MCYNVKEEGFEVLICQAIFLHNKTGVCNIKSKQWADEYLYELEQIERENLGIKGKRRLENSLNAIKFILK